MSLKRDPLGRVLPLGRVRKFLHEPFIPGGALPSWLTADQGTASFGTVTSGTDRSFARVATAATLNTFARIETNFDIAPALYDEIIWRVGGLRYDTDNAALPQPMDAFVEIARNGSTSGISLEHVGTDDTAGIKVFNAGAGNPKTNLNYELLGISGGSRVARNVTLRWQPKIGRVFVSEHDAISGREAVFAEVDVSAAQLTASGVRCSVMIKTREAVAHNLTVNAFDLELIHN